MILQQPNLINAAIVNQTRINNLYLNFSQEQEIEADFYAVEIPPYNLNLILDTEKFYGEEGSGDYTLVFDFTNELGDDTSSKDGRTYWSWFHICETGTNGKCK